MSDIREVSWCEVHDRPLSPNARNVSRCVGSRVTAAHLCRMVESLVVLRPDELPTAKVSPYTMPYMLWDVTPGLEPGEYRLLRA